MVHVVQSQDDFNNQLTNAGEKLIVLDFSADWCGPCKRIAPKLDELASQYAERALVMTVNVDGLEDIAVSYNIKSMPTFVFIKKGNILETFVGGNADRLSKCMEKYVQDEEQTTSEKEMDLKLEQKQLLRTSLDSTVSEMDDEPEGAHMVPPSVAAATGAEEPNNEQRVLEN